jgi:hypothetical protein
MSDPQALANTVRHALRTGRWSAFNEDNIPERREYLAALDALEARANEADPVNQAKARAALHERLGQLHDKLDRERAARETAERERDEAQRIMHTIDMPRIMAAEARADRLADLLEEAWGVVISVDAQELGCKIRAALAEHDKEPA